MRFYAINTFQPVRVLWSWMSYYSAQAHYVPTQCFFFTGLLKRVLKKSSLWERLLVLKTAKETSLTRMGKAWNNVKCGYIMITILFRLDLCIVNLWLPPVGKWQELTNTRKQCRLQKPEQERAEQTSSEQSRRRLRRRHRRTTFRRKTLSSSSAPSSGEVEAREEEANAFWTHSLRYSV